MSNIIKSLKSLQEAVAISSPSVAVLKEISRRLEVIIKEGVEKEIIMSGASYPQGPQISQSKRYILTLKELEARIIALELKEQAREDARAKLARRISAILEDQSEGKSN